jgi:aryl-phospho-beta-D-glucosidase BglC (GH1 family)
MMKKVLIVLAAMMLIASFAQAAQFRVNSSGVITVDGVPTQVKGGSWFGLEGRHEPSDDPNNPSGAPMEMYMGNVWWAESGRTYDQDIQEFKSMGFNTIRLPIAPQTLNASDPQGMAPYLKNAPSVVIANAYLAMTTVIQKLTLLVCMLLSISTLVLTT